ncbi:MAG: tRNA (guanosine(37)-N1)-methyltransferase TrmD [Firmicutes bacterium]|nr:tRNA (guanosine(37)-N1)-methyltransferase TrmD [Bacillota bacterium]
MKITVLTLFPELFAAVTEGSILGRANEEGLLDVDLVNIRDYTLDKHGRTDDTPFGGGAGMVFTPEPCFRALRALGVEPLNGMTGRAEEKAAKRPRLLYPSPRGRMLDRDLIEELAGEEELLILCGHYEGVDERILGAFGFEEVSTGDYILTGGELPAMTVIDAVARFLPGVLGNEASNDEESVYSGLLEYPQYTKPRVYEGLAVPDVLVSGDHEKIRLWRFEQSLRLTKERRPDLFRAYAARFEEALRAKKLPLESGGLSRKELALLKQVVSEERG